MAHQRIQKTASWNPPTQKKSSQFAPPTFTVQAQQNSQTPPTQQEIENQAFNQNKFEAYGLQLKQKYGTITPVESERLGVLQAKMDDFWAQRMEQHKAQPNLLEILSRNAGKKPTQAAVTVQPMSPIEQPPLPIAQRVETEGGAASPDLEHKINAARGGGQNLAPELQAQMGQAMGADFSPMRVHTDLRADTLNRSLGARGFTTGQDLFFKRGEYQPGSRGGQELIAHQLTHVVQQREGDSSLQTSKIASGKVIQRLKRKHQGAEGENVDINKVSLIRVYNILRRPDPDPDTDGFIFEDGDREALRARAEALLPHAFDAMVEAQVNPDDLEVLRSRNVQVSGQDQQSLLRFMQAMQKAGIIKGFDEWLASTSTQNAEERQDRMNELWEAARRIVFENTRGINLAEAVIPGSKKTADLSFGDIQVEVKTYRAPITRQIDELYDQLQAALRKFVPAEAGNYEVTLFASLNNDLLGAGITKTKRGNITTITVDPKQLTFTEVTKAGGKQVNKTTTAIIGKMVKTLNEDTYAGTDKIRRVVVVMENAASFECIKEENGTWQGRII